MSITLSDGTTTIELPDSLNWTDRVWSPVLQSVTRGITGKPLIMSDANDLGRPITLQPPEKGGWMPKSNEAQIIAWHNTLEQKLVLSFHGEIHNVQFRHYEPPAYSSTPLFYEVELKPDDIILPTFKFMTAEP